MKITKRGQQVLDLLVEGMTNSEIAEELLVSEVTVRKHLPKIIQDNNLKNRIQLVVRYVRCSQ